MKHQLLAILLFLGCFYSFAEKVEINTRETPGKDSKTETPIDVDLTNATLSINLNKGIQAHVVVVGPEGIIYQQSISLKSYQSIRIDLMQYQDGDYTITFYNINGEVLEGAFFLHKL